MQIAVSAGDELPIYRQIMRQITAAIAGGRLRRGDKLASHRELSEQLVIAPLTVKKAYDELEALGYIETQRGRGTFVTATRPRAARASHLGQVEEAGQKFLSEAYLAGLSFDEAVEILADADREITGSGTVQEKKT